MIGDLTEQSREFELLVEPRLRREARPEILAQLGAYIAAYRDACGLDNQGLVDTYLRFARAYQADVKSFLATTEYPATGRRSGPQVMPRESYDVALLLSTVCAYHRYRIMETLARRRPTAATALVGGCGAGLDVALVKHRYGGVTAFDTEVSAFCRAHHPDVTFVEGTFEVAPGRTGDVYLIELLEHVADPATLLAAGAACLTPTSRLHVTTASNVPQFDHLVNFAGVDFARLAAGVGLAVESCEVIRHAHRNAKLNASNAFYTLRRV